MLFIRKYRYQLFTIFYLLFVFTVLSYIYFDKNSRVASQLQSSLKTFEAQKKTLYSGFKIASENIYHTLQNDHALIALLHGLDENNKDNARQLLYQTLKDRFERIKHFGVEQFHFHLPDGESFLRIHQPSSYGDNLKDVRYSIRKVIETKEAIEGFEIGRVGHGFRFVYPLFFHDSYVASVEISMSTDIFQTLLEQSFHNEAGILINSKYVEQSIWEQYTHTLYKKSNFNEKFLVNIDNTISFTNITDMLEARQPFAIYEPKSKNAISFIPINDLFSKETVAYLFSAQHSQTIAKIYSDYYIVTALLLTLFSLIYWFLYKDILYKRGLRNIILGKTQELKEKEKALMQQSRLAQMGELINMIAHQWRQPLAAINSTANSLIIKGTMDRYDKDFFLHRLSKISDYSQQLSETVDDFRNFFKTHKEQREITLEEICNDSVSILENSFIAKNITLMKRYNCNQKLYTHPNELRQVVLNLIKNAEDAIIEKHIKDGIIVVETKVIDKEFYAIVISDNAGGIDESIIDKIYDPYFTTKDEKNGSGLGLYMSSMIINEHCNGEMSVSNGDLGAIFSIKLKVTRGKDLYDEKR